MSLPADLTLVTVKGNYVDLQGAPLAGVVTFEFPQAIVHTASNTKIFPETIEAYLDLSGSFEVEVPATDDPDIAPTGFTCRVTEILEGRTAVCYNIEIPWDTDGAIDLLTVVPVTPVTQVPSLSWDTLLGKPTSFPPATHAHSAGELAGVETPAGAQAKADAAKTAAIAASLALAQKGAASGVASLDSSGQLQQNLPATRLVGVLSDGNIPGTVQRRGDLYFSVRDYGARGDGSTDDSAAFYAAMDAADSAGGGTCIFVPPGRYNVGTGLSLDGRRCGIVGTGAGYSFGQPTGSVIYAKTQAGPILDFTGWIFGSNFRGRAQFSGFTLQGSNVDNTANHGIFVPGQWGCMAFRDIVITQTGGIPLYLRGLYLSTFDSVTLVQPVKCKTNNTPYFLGENIDGSIFTNLGIMAVASAESCPQMGAIHQTDNGTFVGGINSFRGVWFENCFVPSGGTMWHTESSANTISDTIFYDCAKETGATDTSYYRFTPAGTTALGGNLITGNIPSRSGLAPQIDYGVDLFQDGNSIIGTKTLGGHNVRINSGVKNTYVNLGGAVGAAENYVAVDDLSGNDDNVYLDSSTGTYRLKNNTLLDSLANGVLRVQNTATPADGGVFMGNAGAYIRAQNGGGSIYHRPGGTNQAIVMNNSASAEVGRFDNVGLTMAAGAVVRTGRGTTRPTASTAGAGATFFDTTLGKPIWSTGTKWVLSDGTDAP